jgi:murein DD-endopeptidase MepM/ murein hydrolase activator NlpD
MELAGIFGWAIDFVYDVQQGRSVSRSSMKTSTWTARSSAPAASCPRASSTAATTYIALLYTDSNGDTDYYAPDGKQHAQGVPAHPDQRPGVLAVQPAAPPLRYWTWFAPTRAPTMARTSRHADQGRLASGRVRFAGWKGGYGRTVVLQHGDNITTLYAHMSRLGKGISRMAPG